MAFMSRAFSLSHRLVAANRVCLRRVRPACAFAYTDQSMGICVARRSYAEAKWPLFTEEQFDDYMRIQKEWDNSDLAKEMNAVAEADADAPLGATLRAALEAEFPNTSLSPPEPPTQMFVNAAAEPSKVDLAAELKKVDEEAEQIFQAKREAFKFDVDPTQGDSRLYDALEADRDLDLFRK